MHIAVDKGADEGKPFLHYVEHLDSKGYLPPGGKDWVDYIRKKANEANHDIVLMRESDAKVLIDFVEMLLKFVFDFPKRIPTTE